jgi:hypothetical protein
MFDPPVVRGKPESQIQGWQGDPPPEHPGWKIVRRDYISMDGSILYSYERLIYS